MTRNGLPKAKGFTLIELMIVIVIVAILVGVALPAYQNQIRKTKRGVGKGELLKVAAAQEQFFVNNKQYAGDLLNLGYDEATDGFEVDSEARVVLDGSSDAIYLITLSTTTNAYTLQAAPRNGQTKDKFCQTLTLSSTGVKGVTGGAQWTAKECW